VQNASADCLLPAAMHALASKEEVAFGPITLCGKGIEIKGDLKRWRDVEKAYVGNGHFHLEYNDSSQKSYPLSEVPNYVLMLAILHEQLGDRLG
jgi:hypothetical protein